MLPVYTLRGVVSSSAMILIVLTFGAPVMDAHGKSALKISVSDALVFALTVDVICQSVG